MSSLPLDLAPVILSHLPIKDLLRFRCVSRSWCSLIDSPYFAKLHLSRSQKTGSNLFILDKIKEFRSFHFDSLEETPEILQLPPIRSSPDLVEIAGSCNGVVAVYDHSEGDVSLWNPFTRKLRELPSSKITAENPGHCRLQVAYGFGYDSVMDDYKLVRIAKFKNRMNSSFINKVEVFRLKTDTWREIEWPFPSGLYTFEDKRSEALVNNALHWICYSSPPVITKIISFDLVKEEFYLVSHPDCDSYLQRVGELGGCLCLAFSPLSFPFGLHVWVMNKYNVKESWSKIFFLPTNIVTCATPIAYSKDRGRILLNYSDQLAWYDLARKTFDFVNELGGGRCVLEPTLCIRSLIALDWKSENNGW